MKSGTSLVPCSMPSWIWHPERASKTSLTLSKVFSIEKEAYDVNFFAAFTGSLIVELDGIEIGRRDEHPQNVTVFTPIAAFPNKLQVGEHILKLTISCTSPMAIEPVNAYLSDRTVGCIAFLQGKDVWISTDSSWETEETKAEIVCLLGEEPYGDLENSPEWFVAGGYGDIVAKRITHFDIISSDHIQCLNLEWKLSLSGKQTTKIDLKENVRVEKFLFYHLLKQEDWKNQRTLQNSYDLTGAPQTRIDLKKEDNIRFRATNLGKEAVTLLWNGAESLFELDSYQGCITEWFVIPCGQSYVTLPQGLRFFQLYILDTVTNKGNLQSFDIEIEFESVGAEMQQIGSFHGDLPLLNDIYEVAVHTNKVCHQLGLWDGIKRDRLNWAYDFYLAAKTDYVVWDDFSILKRSITELGKTPYGYWMNGISAYTFWWINNLWEYFLYTNDRAFIMEVKEDLHKHISWIEANLNPRTGFIKERHTTLIEWVPMEEDEAWIALHAVLSLSRINLGLLAKHIPELELNIHWTIPVISESEFLHASALITPLLGIAGGYVSNNRSMEFLDAYQLKDPLTPISAFWLAECYSKYGKHEQAWHVISTVWGKMLSEDATTFWESVVLSPQSDYHDSQTTYTSYESYRMSLCHSWASTPPQWISRYVLGVGPLEPGYERISFSPNAIGGLTQCSGTISTPLGPINVEWKLREDGTMDAKIDMPKAVTQQVS